MPKVPSAWDCFSFLSFRFATYLFSSAYLKRLVLFPISLSLLHLDACFTKSKIKTFRNFSTKWKTSKQATRDREHQQHNKRKLFTTKVIRSSKLKCWKLCANCDVVPIKSEYISCKFGSFSPFFFAESDQTECKVNIKFTFWFGSIDWLRQLTKQPSIKIITIKRRILFFALFREQ